MRRLLLSLAFALSAAPAFAQGTEAEPQAAPGSIGYGIIENADAEGVFELVHDGRVTLRHIGSGLICRFQRDGEGGRIILYSGLPRGDDVACDMDEGGATTTLFATRFPFATSLDEQIAGAEQAIRNRFPSAVPYQGETRVSTDTPNRTVQFFIARDGERYYTRASVAQVGPWTIKMRYSRRAADEAAAREGELASNLLFAATLREIGTRPDR